MIKIGVIGAGRMGITHHSIINSHPKVSVSYVVEPSAFLRTMLHKYLNIKTFNDFTTFFKEARPDAILVCTPPAFHYPIIRLAYEHDVHVFVEKPFTTVFSEANELAQLYHKKGLVNQVGYVNRFNDAFIRTRVLLKQGIIGKVVSYKAEMYTPTKIKKSNDSGWRVARITGGGALFEIASHLIDLTNFFFDYPEKIVGSVFNKVYSDNVEDIITSTFLYKQGFHGTILVNWSDESYRKAALSFEICGEKGKIQVDQHGYKVYLKQADEEHLLRKGWTNYYFTDIYKQVPFYVRGNDFTKQLYHFVDLIENKEASNVCSFEEGAKTLSIIEELISNYTLVERK